jgi:adenylate cyclase
MLNDTFETLTAALRPRGGHVLKFIGDAMLATISFDERDEKAACRRALDAAVEASANLKFVTWNVKRQACRLPMLISLCTSAKCCTATSARWTGLTSPRSDPRSMKWFEWKSSVNLLANRSCSQAEAAGRCDGRLESLGHFQLRGVDEAKQVFGLRLSQADVFQRLEA